MNVVELQDVSKKYSVYDHPGARVLEWATLGRARLHRETWALQGVSLGIKPGETFCIIGENGSGKSTLLQLIAGILRPSGGTVRVQGRVAALLELGAGFHPEFSGRDNLFLNASILGLPARQVRQKMASIADFAEIGDAIDQPVRTYSSGMVMRLAFAMAVHVDADLLIVDEALAVGDIYFRQRCMRKIHELREQGGTIVFVSHDIGDVKALGHRVMWLREGRVVQVGDPREVAPQYMAELLKKDSSYRRREAPPAEPTVVGRERPREIITSLPERPVRHGDGRARVVGVTIVNRNGQPVEKIRAAASIVVRISVQAEHFLPAPIVGVQVRNEKGVDFAGTNTTREGVELAALQSGEIRTVDFHLDLPELPASHFTFSPAVADGALTDFELCDMVQDAISIRVEGSERPVYGHMHIPCNWVDLTRSKRPAG